MINSYSRTEEAKRGMSKAIRRTISLPPELADEADQIAREEGKTFSGVVQDALRLTRAQRRRSELRELQNFWSRKAREEGVVSDDELERYLSE